MKNTSTEKTHPSGSDLYIEFTGDDFKMKPSDVMQEHFLSAKWKTEKAYRIIPFQSGTYLIYDLHKNPHYQLPQSMRSSFNQKAKQLNIPVTTIKNDVYEEKNTIYHYSSQSQIYEQHVNPHIKSFCLEDIILMLDEEKESRRGNFAKTVGWHSLNFVADEKRNISIPGRTANITTLDKNTMKIMTIIMKTLYSNITPAPFATNTKRTKEWANELVLIDHTEDINEKAESEPKNVFESITYAMTYVSSNKDDGMLKTHIDQFNCNQYGFNCVFGIYFHLKHPKKRHICSCCIAGVLKKIHL